MILPLTIVGVRNSSRSHFFVCARGPRDTTRRRVLISSKFDSLSKLGVNVIYSISTYACGSRRLGEVVVFLLFSHYQIFPRLASLALDLSLVRNLRQRPALLVFRRNLLGLTAAPAYA